MSIIDRALEAMRGPEVPMSVPLGRAWYVACTAPRAEFDVVRELTRLGLDAYTPAARYRTTVRGRKTTVDRALFVGYVFVGFDIEREEWFGPIMDTDGVRSILSCQQIPIKLATGEIEKLRRAQAAGVFDFTHPGASFAEGAAVRIEEGPFSGFVARVKSATAKKRVRILLEFLGSPKVIDIDPAQLSAA